MAIEYASVTCLDCKLPLAVDVPYADGEDHKKTGLAAGAALTHRHAHPGHRVRFERGPEPVAPSSTMTAEERAALADAAKRHHEEVAERIRRRVEHGPADEAQAELLRRARRRKRGR